MKLLKLRDIAQIWLVTSAVADVFIALSLLWYLNRVRVSAKKFEQRQVGFLSSGVRRAHHSLTSLSTGTVDSPARSAEYAS